MQIVIEISERDYELMKARICKSSSDFIILNGTPLEDIKAEIETKAKERELYLDMGHPHDGLYEALEIINKHTSGKEQEK